MHRLTIGLLACTMLGGAADGVMVDSPAAGADSPLRLNLSYSRVPELAERATALLDVEEPPLADASQGAPRRWLSSQRPATDGLGLDLPFSGIERSIERLLTAEEPDDLDFGEEVHVRVGRTTALRDGGIGGTREAIANADPGAMHLYGFTSGDGEFDLHDLSLNWDALRPGPVTLSLSGGLRAIQADVVRERVTTDESGGVMRSSLDRARGVVPVPVVGGGVRWDVQQGFYLSGNATTHTFDEGATYLGLSAETGISLNPNVGIFAGYQYVRSSLEVQAVDARLSQEGVFARLQIRF